MHGRKKMKVNVGKSGEYYIGFRDRRIGSIVNRSDLLRDACKISHSR